MTNEEIVLRQAIRLMKEGIIGTTGRQIKLKNDKGEEVIFNEPEAIHTYAAWKELGYQVKKGEHAKAQFTIWKHTPKDEEKDKDERMFMKRASFFTRQQVEEV